MSWKPRLDVVEALEEHGWTGDADNPLGLLRHNGAVWGVVSDRGDSSLSEPGGAVIDFPGDTSDGVIVAACLAASGQAGQQADELVRLRRALESAKRRAKRRQPHEREGLIFHLERQNNRLSAFANLANEAALASGRGWDDAREEARKVRERNGALLARIDVLAKRLRQVTEYRMPPVPPAYTPLTVRRDPAYDGARWAVVHDPGDLSVRRVWTEGGWEMAWALTGDETYCWPSAETALVQARLAQAADDREPDVDGAGRTRESYGATPSETPAP